MCIHFHIYAEAHPEVFFKKDVLQIFRQSTRQHPCKSVTSTSILIEITLLHGYSSLNMLDI